MNRTQLEHIIRAASQISDDTEIVVIGSQAIHAQSAKLPPIAFLSTEADVYPRNHPERADEISVEICSGPRAGQGFQSGADPAWHREPTKARCAVARNAGERRDEEHHRGARQI